MLLQFWWLFAIIEIYIIASLSSYCSHCFSLVVYSFEIRCITINGGIARTSGLSSWCTTFNQNELLSFLNEPLCSLSLLWLELFRTCNHSDFSVSSGRHIDIRQKTARICRVLLHYRFTSIWQPACRRITVNLTRLCGRGCGTSVSARICDSRAILWLMKNRQQLMLMLLCLLLRIHRHRSLPFELFCICGRL